MNKDFNHPGKGGKEYHPLLLKEKWWHILDGYNVGVIPLPLFILAGVLIALNCFNDTLSSDIVVMVVTLAFFGFACGEFGKRLPIVGKMGAAALCATFIPSALVYYGLLPQAVVVSVSAFYHGTHILYLYICCIIVGSTLSMNRNTLIQGFLRIVVPMLCGEIVGMLTGMAVGIALGMAPFHLFFFLVLPIMAGGIGEGAIPLSIGYAVLLNQDQAEILGHLLPVVMLGSLTAIILAGILNQLGKRFPHLTGEGELMPATGNPPTASVQPEAAGVKPELTSIAAAAVLAMLLYMVGVEIYRITGLPAPVGMLFMAIALKLLNGVSPSLLAGSQGVYTFFQTAVTYPILFAVGVAMTSWQALQDALTLANLLVIISTVLSLVVTGFVVGKKAGMHPIDVAIISCCQSGQGGTGDVAILTAGERMRLMPFAQVATRVGGALSVSFSLLVLNNLLT